MDNKAYLDQIAVKGKVKSGPIFTPVLIKLIAAGVVALITMIVVGSIISSSNAEVTKTYERVYMRITSLASEQSPLKLYAEKLRNSDLRANALSFLSALKSTNVSLSSLGDNIGIKTGAISKTVTEEDSANTGELTSALDDAVLNGNIDQVYATKTYYQITLLLSLEAEARAKTPNQQFASLLDSSTNDLLMETVLIFFSRISGILISV
jgi:hypothetical protein